MEIDNYSLLPTLSLPPSHYPLFRLPRILPPSLSPSHPPLTPFPFPTILHFVLAAPFFHISEFVSIYIFDLIVVFTI